VCEVLVLESAKEVILDLVPSSIVSKSVEVSCIGLDGSVPICKG